MRTVWKYALRDQRNEIDLPLGAQVLHVSGSQAAPKSQALCHLWAEIAEHDTKTLERRTFMVFGTNHPMPAAYLKYIGTAHSPGGEYVWHVYEQRA